MVSTPQKDCKWSINCLKIAGSFLKTAGGGRVFAVLEITGNPTVL
jgi:hypothetical protein